MGTAKPGLQSFYAPNSLLDFQQLYTCFDTTYPQKQLHSTHSLKYHDPSGPLFRSQSIHGLPPNNQEQFNSYKVQRMSAAIIVFMMAIIAWNTQANET